MKELMQRGRETLRSQVTTQTKGRDKMMVKRFCCSPILLVAALFCLFLRHPRPVESMVPHAPSKSTNTRRMFLKTTFASVSFAAVIAPSVARSLDMDAFASQQLSASGSTQGGSSSSSGALTEDQALCKFGQPSPQRGEACLRAGMSTKPSKKGGVDAFGQVDRYVDYFLNSKFANEPLN